MSQQALNLRRCGQIVRRHKILVGFAAVLGLLVGAAYALLHPPMLTSTALVVLPQSAQSAQSISGAANGSTSSNSYTETQEVIAASNQVLLGALPHVRPAMSLTELHRAVQVGSLTPYIISISANGNVATDSEATANAVAYSYIHYIGSASSPVGHMSAQLLQSATSATRSAPIKRLFIYGLLGALAGGLIGFIVAFAISRDDRRLRDRDEIANSIGVPIIGSFAVDHPSDAAGWMKLLEDYQPGAVTAWRLRKALQQLGMADANVDNGVLNDGQHGGSSSLAVLSLSSDPGAFAIGPQLAVFAASHGVPTTLVVGPLQDADSTAILRTACAAPPPSSSKRPSNLRVVVSDTQAHVPPESTLTVVVAVVDGRSPLMPDTMRTAATVIGVSAGAATADQLARAAMSAAGVGREIVGILVADPEPNDRTTGRVPQLPRPRQRRLPTRLEGMTTEIRR